MRINFQRFIGFIVICTMIFSCFTGYAGSHADAGLSEFEVIMNGSVILYAGQSTYYNYGERTELKIDGESYIPLKSGENIYLPVLIVKEMFGLNIDWDIKTETVFMEKNNEKVSIRAGEDALYLNGEGKYIKNLAQLTDNTVMLPFIEIAEAFKYRVKNIDDLYIITNDKGIYDTVENMKVKTQVALMELFENYIFRETFDRATMKMNYGSWNGANQERGFIEDKEEDNSYLYLGVPLKGFGGYSTPKIDRGPVGHRNNMAYKVSFSYKVSEDFSGVFNVAIFCYDNGTFVNLNSIKTVPVDNAGVWKRYTFYISESAMPQVSRSYDATDFELLFRTYDAEKSNSMVYLDDLCVSGCISKDGVIDAHMTADKYAAWYNLGDTVTYSPQYTDTLKYAESINAAVYNYYGEKEYENTVPAYDVINKGWSYTPAENGWYEVEFTANMPDGTKAPVVVGRSFGMNGSTSLGYSYLLRNEFFVAPNGTKPRSERNESLYFCTHGGSFTKQYADDFTRVADLLGFYGNRWISLDWGDRPDSMGSVAKGVESVKGVYDWSSPDAYFELMDKYGFKDNIVCILTTPRWASVPDSKIKDSAGNVISPTQTTSTGFYVYSLYMAENTEDWTNFVEKAAERYKDKVEIWEIWNEPMTGKSAFWYDTAANYARMQSSAYDTIKEVDPEAKVSCAGMGNSSNYTSFLEELIKDDPDFLNKMDYYAVHGSYDTISVVKKIIAESGHKEIPWINTEGYYSAASPNDSASAKASKFLLDYLMQYKMGARITTYFTLFNTHYEVEDITRTGAESDYGAFRYFPYLTPKKAAAAMHTFFELMDKSFSVSKEYEFENGMKGVLCKNGTENFMAVWQPSSKKDILPEKLLNCRSKGGRIMRMDGRTTESAEVPAEQAVYITEVDEEMLDSIYKEKTDTALNTGYVAPVFKCMTSEDLEKAAADSSIKMKLAKAPIFDLDTMEAADDIVWEENNYEWDTEISAEMPVGFRARHCAYVDEKGFYLMVDVSDKTISNETNDPAGMWNMDNVQFSVKVNSETSTNMHEFSVGIASGKPTVYKGINASVLSDQPPAGYIKKGIISDAKLKIEETGRGLMYKIFIPSEQMWPYFYNPNDEYIRFSICVNNNDGDGRLGWLQWGRGIASGGKNSSLFAFAYFDRQ